MERIFQWAKLSVVVCYLSVVALDGLTKGLSLVIFSRLPRLKFLDLATHLFSVW